MNIQPSRYAALLLTCLGFVGAAIPAAAADCPGNPGALGTSRTLVVDPKEHLRIGTMQYEETLPLHDHEVVLTFDDGPLPPHSNQVLDTLAAECVKATFFIIGRMARSFPEGVRRVREAGHSIGTHTENHPLGMKRMPIEAARQEIEDGIAATAAALGEGGGLAPFFRIPGLSRAESVEDYLAGRGIQTWSADFPADDWRHISAGRVYEFAIQRLEAKGKGILLLHDIQGRTVTALPRILAFLKAGGYRIVHVVPATPDRPKTPSEPGEWHLHPVSLNVPIAHWPRIRAFVFVTSETLPAPAVSGLNWRVSQPTPLWPRPATQAGNAIITLAVPDSNVFAIPENSRSAIAQSAILLVHHADSATVPGNANADLSFSAGASRRMIPGSVPIAKHGLKPPPAKTH